MKKPWVLALGACVLLSLTACGKDMNGFGESEGWGGSTKGFGDVDEGYANKEVGLCSYLGGCMPDKADSSGDDKKRTSKVDHGGLPE